MSMRLNPYIQFGNNTAEALDFYKGVFGGESVVSYFKEYGTEGADGDLVMHGQLETDAGFTIMAADSPSFMSGPAKESNITVSLSGDDSGALRGYWEKLSDGANVATPLEKQMWGDEFGQLTDKYGVGWLVNISAPQS
ncbi:MAG TPA: VOC family protein [Lapillicoccus sp.]|nr:VOC family protein [Lapillicoccus sp.]